MSDLPEQVHNYQAHVHFALGGIIQGLMLAALAGELANAFKSFTFPDTMWVFVTALQSLLLCILFWYRFMDNFIFGFRVINMTAKAHYLFALHHLILGLLQFLAIRFLDNPRVWLTFYTLLIITTQGFSFLSSNLQIIQTKGVKDALAYEPSTRFLLITICLSILFLIAWYLFPILESSLYKAAALTLSGLSIISFTHYSLKVFNHHLAWLKEH